MKLYFTDTETTGFNHDVDRITEIAGVIWDTEKRQVLEILSELIKGDTPQISEEITTITGIDQDMLDKHGADKSQVLFRFHEMASKCEAIVAHNAPFDKGFIDKAMMSVDSTEMVWDVNKHWIDTQTDIPYPPNIKTRGLNHLLADHGINPNTFAHRALFDTFKTIELFDKYNASEIYTLSTSPMVRVVANCLPPWDDPKPKKDTDVVKAAGFRWDGEAKKWYTECRQSTVASLSQIEGMSNIRLIATRI